MNIQGGLRQLKICSKKQTNKTPLLSSTSASLTGENSLMHYGVSMSSSDNTSKRIMIAASCLSGWHEYVAGAAMTRLPDYKKIKKNDLKTDGTIKLVEGVGCETFSLTDGVQMFPCNSCAHVC